MKPRHQVSRAAIDLIKRFEGFRQMAAQLPDGRWTIGYGHTQSARPGTEVSERDAEALLLYDLIQVAHTVNEYSFTPMTQNQFDALVCFAFNIGTDNFRRSAVLRRVNEGAMIQAACAMEMWRKADFEGERIVVDALVRRRAAEKSLFLTPPGGRYVPAPTPILEPRIDYDAGLAAPRQTPIEVTTTFEGDRVTAKREDETPPTPVLTGPTASERAASELHTRLSAIFPDDPAEEAAMAARSAAAAVQPEPLSPAPPSREPKTDLQAMFLPQAPEPEPVHSPAYASARTQGAIDLLADPAPGAAPQIEMVADAFNIGADPAPEPRPFGWMPPARKAKAKPPAILPAVFLAVVGAGVFAASILWNARASANVEGDPSVPLMIGWALGLMGVACFSWAAYQLLKRLGGESAD